MNMCKIDLPEAKASSDNNSEYDEAATVFKKKKPKNVMKTVGFWNWAFSKWTTWHGFWNNIRQLWYLPKRIYQRMRYGVCYADVWNFDAYIAEVLANGARHLKEYACGYPGYGEADTPEKWDDILEDLAKTAEDYVSEPWDNDWDINIPDSERKVTIEETIQKQRDNYNHLMELLNKWFGHLWD